MSTNAYISLFVLSLIVIVTLRKKMDVFSPARLFIIVWCVAIFLTELKFSKYQFEWSVYSWIILYLSCASFLLGTYYVYSINYAKPIHSVQTMRISLSKQNINVRLLYKMIVIFFIIYMVSYIVIYLYVGFIPVFTKRPDLTKSKWTLFGFGLLIHLAPSILYFSGLFWLVAKGNIFKKIKLLLYSAITFVTFIFLLQRFGIIVAILLLLVFLYYATFKLKFKVIFPAFLLIVLFIFAISNIRAGNVLVDYLYYSGGMKYSHDYAIFTEPYMYVVMNLENFANAVGKLNVFTYGANTFDFVFAISGLKHTLIEYCNINEFPHIITADYNTYTMFFTYYRDYGIIGSFVLPLVLGSVVSSIYYKMKQEPNINSITLYGICVFVILFTFFVPVLSWLNYMFNFFVIYFTTKIIMVKNIKKNIKYSEVSL